MDLALRKKWQIFEQRKSKLNFQGDGPFQVLKRVNNNTYQLNLSDAYGVHITFNVTHLIPFSDGTNEEAEALDLRINPLQERGMIEGSSGKDQLLETWLRE